ncbi:MAG TPA: hypothetical protein VN916_03980 [Candidatus Acidoferrum sp.]|nr:hypothetical protein [Candidatus Acidoferrum sp.]
MLDDRIIRAARNNAEWCDAVCRSHGNPGEFHEDMWLNRNPVPRFYPNAGTLAEPSQQQLDLIDELIAARLPRGWAVKDSFSMLDLESRGFRMLFDAEWIYLPVSRVKDIVAAEKSTEWEVVRNDLALAEWESAWSRSAGDTGEDRIFLASLLENRDVAVVAGFHDGQIVAGAIANRSDGVVGWSNFFAPAPEIFDHAVASLATIARIFPGSPIVGYEHGDDLRNAHSLGFESIGPLRVWTFQS